MNILLCLVPSTYLKAEMIFQQYHLRYHIIKVMKKRAGDDDLDILRWPLIVDISSPDMDPIAHAWDFNLTS